VKTPSFSITDGLPKEFSCQRKDRKAGENPTDDIFKIRTYAPRFFVETGCKGVGV